MMKMHTGFTFSALMLVGLAGCAGGAGTKIRNLSTGPLVHKAKTEYQFSVDPKAPLNAPFVRRARSRHPRLHYEVQVGTSSGGNQPEINLTCQQNVGKRFRVYTYQYRLRGGQTKTVFAPNAMSFPDEQRNFGRHNVEPGEQKLYVKVRVSGAPALHRRWGRAVRLTIRSKLSFKIKAGQAVNVMILLQSP